MQTIKVNDKTYNVTNVTDGDPHKELLKDIHKKSEESIKTFNEQLSKLNEKITKDKDTCEVGELKFTATPLMLEDAKNAYLQGELTSKKDEGFDDTINTRYPNIMNYFKGKDKLEEKTLPNNDKNKKIIAEIEKIKAYKIAHPIFEEYLTKWRKAEEEKAAAQATAKEAAKAAKAAAAAQATAAQATARAVTETQAALEAQAAALAVAAERAAEEAAATAVAEKEAKSAAETKAAEAKAAAERAAARVAREAEEAEAARVAKEAREARERAAAAKAAAERAAKAAAAKIAADEKAAAEALKQAAEKKASEQAEDAKAKAAEALLVGEIAQLSEAADKKRAETNKKPKTNIYEQAAINARALKPQFKGGSRKSKNYIKYKKEYLKLKEELNQLHK